MRERFDPPADPPMGSEDATRLEREEEKTEEIAPPSNTATQGHDQNGQGDGGNGNRYPDWMSPSMAYLKGPAIGPADPTLVGQATTGATPPPSPSPAAAAIPGAQPIGPARDSNPNPNQALQPRRSHELSPSMAYLKGPAVNDVGPEARQQQAPPSPAQAIPGAQPVAGPPRHSNSNSDARQSRTSGQPSATYTSTASRATTSTQSNNAPVVASDDPPLLEARLVTSSMLIKEESQATAPSGMAWYIPTTAGSKWLCFGFACLIAIVTVVVILCVGGVCRAGDGPTPAPVATTTSGTNAGTFGGSTPTTTGDPAAPGTPATAMPTMAATPAVTSVAPTSESSTTAEMPSMESTNPPVLVIDVASSTPTSEPVAILTTPPPNTPQPSSQPAASNIVYRARYFGRFQHVLSPGCQAPNPTVTLYCGGQIENVRTTNPDIRCAAANNFTLSDGRNAVVCEPLCAGAACESVFVSTRTLGAEPIGGIFFECTGRIPLDVFGGLGITGNTRTPGSCNGTDPNSHNLRLVQLGLSCPVEGAEAEYVFDNLYVECGPGNMPIQLYGNYTCHYGRTCGSSPCEVSFDQQLLINADPNRFEHCIIASDESPVPEIPEPEIPPRPDGIYTARFNMVWHFLADMSVCIGSEAEIRATCTNGNITILSQEADKCAQVSSSAVVCNGNPAMVEGMVEYQCSSFNELPDSTAEFATGTTNCFSSSVEQIVEHILQLGIFCGDQFVYEDIFLECGAGDDFDIIASEGFSCLESVTIPPEPGAGTYTIPAVFIETDYRWHRLASDICFDFEPN
ncbi:expressed unknown protein [Seminavis robusta]|uniref:Uncharacterized protein n=1 Tax=Seminavis robusta TaxID=568900 RepID=A0A9N8H4L4_9STRA|nr:expressed unknown protein [Seminavis robusta]|eukprot:Sro10_g007940.1 n/a (797) ;mRNA; f:53854-56405